MGIRLPVYASTTSISGRRIEKRRAVPFSGRVHMRIVREILPSGETISRGLSFLARGGPWRDSPLADGPLSMSKGVDVRTWTSLHLSCQLPLARAYPWFMRWIGNMRTAACHETDRSIYPCAVRAAATVTLGKNEDYLLQRTRMYAEDGRTLSAPCAACGPWFVSIQGGRCLR